MNNVQSETQTTFKKALGSMVLSRWSDRTMLATVIQEEVHSGFVCDGCEGNPMNAGIEDETNVSSCITQV